MELGYRKCHPHLRDTFLETLRNNDILYLWSCNSEEWSEEVGDSLIKIIAKKCDLASENRPYDILNLNGVISIML